jgi:hypothetical protein
MSEEVKSLSWWARLTRKKAKLTYWLDGQCFVTEVNDFNEKSPDCIVFKDFYTNKNIMVKHNSTITYVLEELS